MFWAVFLKLAETIGEAEKPVWWAPLLNYMSHVAQLHRTQFEIRFNVSGQIL